MRTDLITVQHLISGRFVAYGIKGSGILFLIAVDFML